MTLGDTRWRSVCGTWWGWWGLGVFRVNGPAHGALSFCVSLMARAALPGRAVDLTLTRSFYVVRLLRGPRTRGSEPCSQVLTLQAGPRQGDPGSDVRARRPHRLCPGEKSPGQRWAGRSPTTGRQRPRPALAPPALRCVSARKRTVAFPVHFWKRKLCLDELKTSTTQ